MPKKLKSKTTEKRPSKKRVVKKIAKKEIEKEKAEIEDILADVEKEGKVEHLEHLEKGQLKKKMFHLRYTTPIRLYRRIALFFTLTTFLILIFVLYFSLSKAEITITPRKYLVNADFNVNVESVPISENSIVGSVVEDIRSESMEFEIGGEGQIREGVARGKVTIINNTSFNQTLVATTRLLSPQNVLFHLSEQVTVPAGGTVTADVYADKSGEGSDIGPTKFTIPGLRNSLQDKIYAVSEEPMRGGKIVVKIVKQEDINSAKNVLKEKIISDVKESLNKLAGETSGVVFWTEVLEEKVDAKVGDEREKFKVSTKIKTLGIVYDKKALEKMAQEKVNLIIPAERVVEEVLFQDIRIDLVKYDAPTESAILKISVPARTTIKDDVAIFDKQQLVGLKKKDAKDYLENFEEIESTEIKTRPFWLRRLPSLAERIKIIIQ